jgi:hypothetical protein
VFSVMAGPAPPTGGSGLRGGRLSHGRLLSSSSPLHPLLLRRVGVCGLGSNSPEAARVASCLGGLGGGLNSGARRGTRGRLGCAGGARGTPRRRGPQPVRRFRFGRHPKREVGVTRLCQRGPRVTQFGGPLCSDRAARAVGGDGGGRLLGRGWAESGAGLDRRLAAC